MTEQISTRFLVLSDTHGDSLIAPASYRCHADVLIYCGDFTEESKLEEFKQSVNLLRRFNAPLKLVIAGNHDWTLDAPTFEKRLAEIKSEDPAAVKREYGDPGEVRALFETKEAKSAGILLLDEGSHQFTLANGALLKVFASPFTPSVNAGGFQYHPLAGHEWPVPKGVDVVITHGPPKGIMDYTCDRTRAGDGDLFGAIAEAQPQLHCFRSYP